MLIWHQVGLYLALLCTIGLHHGIIEHLQMLAHSYHCSIPPDQFLLEQLILLLCDITLQVRVATNPLHVQPNANAMWKLSSLKMTR